MFLPQDCLVNHRGLKGILQYSEADPLPVYQAYEELVDWFLSFTFLLFWQNKMSAVNGRHSLSVTRRPQ